MILSSRKVDVDEVNEIILDQFSGEVREFHSADRVVSNRLRDEGEKELSACTQWSI